MKKIISFWVVFLLTIVSVEAAKQQPRKFYLTQGQFTGAQALTACTEGYHMASLWEVLDVSSLRYDTTLGYTLGDSGSGPVTLNPGWIRTGNVENGTDNCFAWTSSSSSDTGAVVFLPGDWPFTASKSQIDPWDGSLLGACSFPFRVWCVQD